MAAAKASAATPEYIDNADVTEVPSDWEFEVVRDEAPIGVIFEKPGESFVGKFVKKAHVEQAIKADGQDDSFDMYVFEARNGKPYSLPASYALNEAYEDNLFGPGDWCLITYVKDIERGAGKNPMKDLRIGVRR